MFEKDYKLIAWVLKRSHDYINDFGAVVYEFADELEREYPKFDRQKFLTACGVETEKKIYNDNVYPKGFDNEE